jgi:rhodanese-related sulfurtransferase
MVEQITPVRAQELLATGEVELVDVRETPEWQGGHIPGARHVALSRLRNGAKALLPRDNVIFVCAAGSRSNMAAQLALAAGLRQVYNLSGGQRAWASAGLPIDTSVTSAVG